MTQIVTTLDQLEALVEAYLAFPEWAIDTPCAEWGKSTDGCGYGFIRIQKRLWRTHRYVMALVLGRDLEPGECVLHRCDNPPCCLPAHLFVGTKGMNNADRDQKGRQRTPVGPAHGMSKFTEDQVREIRRQRAEGETLQAIGARFGVHHSTIRRITTRETWAHLV